MKAVAFARTGPPDVLTVMELPPPEPAADEVLIAVKAAGVNPADSLFRSGQLPFARFNLPFVPGLDVAGVVEAVGAQVTRFKVGDRVYGMLPNTKMGGYAERVTLTQSAVASIPVGVSFAEAAAIPCAGLTALQALRDYLAVMPDTRMLVNGASGGVGSFAVQIAKAMGAHVTGVASTRNIDFMRQIGADETIDYTQTDLTSLDVTYDALFDAVGVLPYRVASPLFTNNAVTVNPSRGNPLMGLVARLRGQRWSSLFVQPAGADLETLNGWLLSGQVRPIIERCYPLEEAAEAHRASETNRVRGKLVLMVSDEA